MRKARILPAVVLDRDVLRGESREGVDAHVVSRIGEIVEVLVEEHGGVPGGTTNLHNWSCQSVGLRQARDQERQLAGRNM